MVRVHSPKSRARRVRVGLSVAQEESLKRQLLSRTCSSAWVDAQFKGIADTGPDGQEIVVRMHDPNVYPPRADSPSAAMRVCRACGVPTPPNCVGSSGVCLDCACGANPGAQAVYGTSSFHAAMEFIRATNVRLLEYRLAAKIS